MYFPLLLARCSGIYLIVLRDGERSTRHGPEDVQLSTGKAPHQRLMAASEDGRQMEYEQGPASTDVSPGENVNGSELVPSPMAAD